MGGWRVVVRNGEPLSYLLMTELDRLCRMLGGFPRRRWWQLPSEDHGRRANHIPRRWALRAMFPDAYPSRAESARFRGRHGERMRQEVLTAVFAIERGLFEPWQLDQATARAWITVLAHLRLMHMTRSGRLGCNKAQLIRWLQSAVVGLVVVAEARVAAQGTSPTTEATDTADDAESVDGPPSVPADDADEQRARPGLPLLVGAATLVVVLMLWLVR